MGARVSGRPMHASARTRRDNRPEKSEMSFCDFFVAYKLGRLERPKMYLGILFFLQRVLCEFLSVLVDFLSVLHSSSSFECVSDIVSVIIIFLRCSFQ